MSEENIFFINTSPFFASDNGTITEKNVNNIPFSSENIGENFVSNARLETTFQGDSNSWSQLDHSSCEFDITLHDGLIDGLNGAVSDHQTGLIPSLAWSKGGPINFFSSIHHYANDVFVCESLEPESDENYYYKSHFSEPYLSNTCQHLMQGDYESRLNLLNGEVDATKAVLLGLNDVPAGFTPFPSDGVAGFRSGYGRIHHTLQTHLKCLSSFRSGALWPPGVRHKLVFFVNQNWFKNALEFNDIGQPFINHDLTKANQYEAGYVDGDVNSRRSRSYAIFINSMTFNHSTISGKSIELDSPNMVINLNEYKNTVRPLTGSTSQQVSLNLPKNLFRLSFGLQNKRINEGVKGYNRNYLVSDTNVFSGDRALMLEPTNEHLNLISYYYLLSNNQKYPDEINKINHVNTYYDQILGDFDQTSNIFNTTMSALNSEDNLTTRMSKNEWSKSPFYCDTIAHEELMSENAKLFLEFKSVVVPTIPTPPLLPRTTPDLGKMQVVVRCEYSEVLHINFNDGRVETIFKK
jgi:hypothetical protein